MNEPVNSVSCGEMCKSYLILLLDVMLINVKSQINSILNICIWYNEVSMQKWFLSLDIVFAKYYVKLDTKIAFWVRKSLITPFSI